MTTASAASDRSCAGTIISAACTAAPAAQEKGKEGSTLHILYALLLVTKLAVLLQSVSLASKTSYPLHDAMEALLLQLPRRNVQQYRPPPEDGAGHRLMQVLMQLIMPQFVRPAADGFDTVRLRAPWLVFYGLFACPGWVASMAFQLFYNAGAALVKYSSALVHIPCQDRSSGMSLSQHSKGLAAASLV